MAISEARKKANKKWNDENMKIKYDRIQLVVPKGNKEKIQEFAKSKDKSVNSFIVELIDDAMAVGGALHLEQPEEVQKDV